MWPRLRKETVFISAAAGAVGQIVESSLAAMLLEVLVLMRRSSAEKKQQTITQIM